MNEEDKVIKTTEENLVAEAETMDTISEKETVSLVLVEELPSDQEDPSDESSDPAEEASPAEAPSPAEEPKKRGFVKAIAFVLTLLAFLGIGYASGYILSCTKFMPNTYLEDPINNTTTNISNFNAEKVANLLCADTPQVTITQKDCKTGEPVIETLTLDGSIDASLSYDTQSWIDNQDHSKWFMNLFNEKTIEKPEADTNFDPLLLKRAVNRLYCMQSSHNIKAKNAYIKESFKDGKAQYSIVPSVEGAKIDKDQAYERIQEAVDRALKDNASQDVDLMDLYDLPTIKEDNADLIKSFKHIKEIMSKTIKVHPTSWATETISGETLRGLLNMNEEGFSVNEEALKDYVETIGSWYSISKFNYVNQDTLYDSLKTALLDTKDKEIDADWIEIIPEPKGKSNSPSIIEVSIGDQYLWYYEYGKLILSSPVVTGNPNAGKKATFLGTNYVHTKATNVRLKSDDKDDPYDVKVKYWIGIDGSGYYGIHDAEWRWSFGGDIYTYSPSHGCVNIPSDVAARLYDLVRVGETDVYIYW